MSDSNVFAYLPVKRFLAIIAIVGFLFIFIPNNSADGNANAVSFLTDSFNNIGGKNTTNAIDNANELKTYGVSF